MYLNNLSKEFNIMRYYIKLPKRVISILFILTLLSVTLIPVITIWGKPSKTITNGKKENSNSRAKGKNEDTINLDIFLDEGCNIKAESINWGEIAPGGNSTAVVYIKNRSKIPVTLFCCLADISPDEAAKHLVLEWDREGYYLETHKTVKAVLTLSILDTTYFGSFAVDVLISGTA